MQKLTAVIQCRTVVKCRRFTKTSHLQYLQYTIIHVLYTHFTHCSVPEKSVSVKCHFIVDAKLAKFKQSIQVCGIVN